MKYCFIINPKAGKGAFVAGLEQNIKDACFEANADYDIFISDTPESTVEYIFNTASQAQGETAFLACGGDGTLCKTVIAVMKLPKEMRKNVSVGVVPSGTGNDFVSNFTQKHLFSNIKAQLDSKLYGIDLLKCNDVYSINMVNVGFDSEVVCKKEEIGRRKWLPRKFSYIFSLLITLIRKPGVNLDLVKDSEPKVKKELLLTTLANGAFCGGGFNSNPEASLTDGNIDCITVSNIGRIKFLSMVGDYKKGLHMGDKFKDIVEHFKCKSAHMYFDRETPISIDGEIIRAKELHITVEREALNILLPKNVMPKIEQMLGDKIAQPIA